MLFFPMKIAKHRVHKILFSPDPEDLLYPSFGMGPDPVSSDLNGGNLGAHQGGHATARFLEGFLEGFLKEVLLRRVLRMCLVRVSIETEVLRRVRRRGGAVRRQKHTLSQSTTPFACTLVPAKLSAVRRRAHRSVSSGLKRVCNRPPPHGVLGGLLDGCFGLTCPNLRASLR